ncbi:hypothetical protein CBL_08042 [Carabus blaptoides fortunei]
MGLHVALAFVMTEPVSTSGHRPLADPAAGAESSYSASAESGESNVFCIDNFVSDSKYGALQQIEKITKITCARCYRLYTASAQLHVAQVATSQVEVVVVSVYSATYVGIPVKLAWSKNAREIM